MPDGTILIQIRGFTRAQWDQFKAALKTAFEADPVLIAALASGKLTFGVQLTEATAALD